MLHRQGAARNRRIQPQEVAALQPELLTTRQVAELLGTSPQYVRKLVAAGRLRPALPVTRGQSMWFTRADVLALVQSREEKRARRRSRLPRSNQ